MFKFILPFCLIGFQVSCVSVDSLDVNWKVPFSTEGLNHHKNEYQPSKIQQVFDHYCTGTKQIKAIFELDIAGKTIKEIKEDLEIAPYNIKYLFSRGKGFTKRNNILFFDPEGKYYPVETFFQDYYVIKRPNFNGEKWDTCKTSLSSQVMDWEELLTNKFDQKINPDIINIKQTIMLNNNLRFDTTVDLTYFCKNAIHVENCKF